MEKGIVLQKYIAQSGYCSRREAEEMIAYGEVAINGETAELGRYVQEGDEVIIGRKRILPPAKSIYIALNKPKGYTCSNRHFKEEKNIFELIDIDAKLFSIGRLDKDSHGLILVTNDGDLDNRLSHPRYGHEKEYEVEIGEIAHGEERVIMKMFTQGINIGDGDGTVRAKNIKYLQNFRFVITLTTGKKRQIRRMFNVLGYRVKDLKRISFAGLKLGNLEEGKWRYLDNKEVEFLKRKDR